jgi:exonuclease III
MPWKKWSSHHSQQKSLKCSAWMHLTSDRMISVRFQGKPFSITVIQVYSPTSNAEEAEVEWSYGDLRDLLELICKKDVLFIIGDWNAKVGIQEIPGIMSQKLAVECIMKPGKG